MHYAVPDLGTKTKPPGHLSLPKSHVMTNCPTQLTCRWFVETRELRGEQMSRRIQMIGKKIPTS
jgi:hypothetical protein